MATFSGNVTISAAIDETGASPSHAVAANSYAIVNCGTSHTSGSITVTIAGNTVFDTSVGTFRAKDNIFYVGPGQTISMSGGTGGANSITGVEFTNAV